MNLISKSYRLMGSAFKMGVVTNNTEFAEMALNAAVNEISRIENLLSEFKEDSTTSLVNKNAGIAPIQVTDEFFNLVERACHISGLTHGAFDITVGPLKSLYKFNNQEYTFPDRKQIMDCLNLIGYSQIQLDRRKREICLAKKGMKISFAAIGKGYAADRVKKLWIDLGIENGYISASGDISVLGHNEKGKAWNIAIADPDQKEIPLFYVPVIQKCVATSGDYEQFFIYKNQRYSHNINPFSGLPLQGTKSVTVFSPAAELSDALATAIYVMGIKKGLSFINQLPDTQAILVDDKNKVYFSDKIAYEVVETSD